MANKKLHEAKVAKKDEFYTRLEDIGNEMKHYRDFFRGKSVLCNCDDPYESNFFKFFALNFNAWGLKKLTATCYDGSPVAGQQLELPFDDMGGATLLSPNSAEEVNGEDVGRQECRPSHTAYKIEITEVPDMNGDGAVDMTDVDILIRSDKNVLTKLKGNGDFRSPECVEMLKQADVVVTNPPFSLFREYVAQLVEYDKKFLIIGNKNAITYKEIFPLIKENKLWTGYRSFSGGMWFKALYEGKTEKIEDGVKLINVPSIWFTNIDHKKRHEWLDLYKTYTPEEYPTYDNYDAINVDKTADIPMDYDGVMGVPITFMDKYNPEQFEIVNANDYRKSDDVPIKPHGLIKDKEATITERKTSENAGFVERVRTTYARMCIKRIARSGS